MRYVCFSSYIHCFYKHQGIWERIRLLDITNDPMQTLRCKCNEGKGDCRPCAASYIAIASYSRF